MLTTTDLRRNFNNDDVHVIINEVGGVRDVDGCFLESERTYKY